MKQLDSLLVLLVASFALVSPAEFEENLEFDQSMNPTNTSTSIINLPLDNLVHIVRYLDYSSWLNLYAAMPIDGFLTLPLTEMRVLPVYDGFIVPWNIRKVIALGQDHSVDRLRHVLSESRAIQWLVIDSIECDDELIGLIHKHHLTLVRLTIGGTNLDLITLQRILGGLKRLVFLSIMASDIFWDGAFFNFLGSIKLHLQILDVDLCHLSSLSPDSFVDLKELHTLYCSMNNLSTLPARVFAPLFNLRHLDLCCNPFTYLDASMFEGLKSLRVLKLYGVPFGAIARDTVFNLEELHIIILALDTFQEAPSSEQCLEALRYVGIQWKFVRMTLNQYDVYCMTAERLDPPDEPTTGHTEYIVDITA